MGARAGGGTFDHVTSAVAHAVGQAMDGSSVEEMLASCTCPVPSGGVPVGHGATANDDATDGVTAVETLKPWKRSAFLATSLPSGRHLIHE